jgi:hypothetical protein
LSGQIPARRVDVILTLERHHVRHHILRFIFAAVHMQARASRVRWHASIAEADSAAGHLGTGQYPPRRRTGLARPARHEPRDSSSTIDGINVLRRRSAAQADRTARLSC